MYYTCIINTGNFFIKRKDIKIVNINLGFER